MKSVPKFGHLLGSAIIQLCDNGTADDSLLARMKMCGICSGRDEQGCLKILQSNTLITIIRGTRFKYLLGNYFIASMFTENSEK